MYKHILIPTDGSEQSRKAIAHGIDLARTVRAKVTLLTVSMPIHAFAVDSGKNAAMETSPDSDAEGVARKRLKGGEDYAKRQEVDARAEHVFSDQPYQAILDAAKQGPCDLIVMASHGYKGIQGMILGSETQKVLTHSGISVLVCR